jgi:AcrR family transcriptional regulator
VPRIDARTVAEHHDLHLSRLLDAALAYAAEHDVASLTLAELAKRTRRSRASLYAYFGSAEEMRLTLCAHALTSWISDLIDDLRTIDDLDERLERLVTAQIAGRRDLAVERVTAYALSLQTEPARARVRAVLEPLTTELLAIVDQLGVEPPTRAASMVQGAIAAASDQVRAGADAERVAADTVTFIRAGLAALREQHPAPPAGGAAHRAGPPRVRRTARGASRSGALAFADTPSIAAATLVVLHDAEPTPTPEPRRTHGRIARLVTAQLVWAAAAFVTGLAGVGAAAHAVLGLSLVALLVWTARTLRPPLTAPVGTAPAAVLAVLAAGAALAARSPRIGAALAVHVVLASFVVVALVAAVRAARRTRAAVPGPALTT